jgi:acyl-CoA thioesterase FadM
MPRLKSELPASFSFSCIIPVRITDVNYGNHVGNDAILSIIHEARMQYLQHLGYTEMQFAGVGMIMSEVTIEFNRELFYGETVIASVTAGNISKIGFTLFYKLEKNASEKKLLVATAKTGMICYDYGKKKIMPVPEIAAASLKSTTGGQH